jgi:hypothetical protein
MYKPKKYWLRYPAFDDDAIEQLGHSSPSTVPNDKCCCIAVHPEYQTIVAVADNVIVWLEHVEDEPVIERLSTVISVLRLFWSIMVLDIETCPGAHRMEQHIMSTHPDVVVLKEQGVLAGRSVNLQTKITMVNLTRKMLPVLRFHKDVLNREGLCSELGAFHITEEGGIKPKGITSVGEGHLYLAHGLLRALHCVSQIKNAANPDLRPS